MILIVPSLKYVIIDNKFNMVKLAVIFLVLTGILNPLLDKNNNTDLDVAMYIKDNNLNEKILL